VIDGKLDIGDGGGCVLKKIKKLILKIKISPLDYGKYFPYTYVIARRG